VRIKTVEPLWDAFERMKTILDPDKKTGVQALLERELRTLTSIVDHPCASRGDLVQKALPALARGTLA
jgi:hypothetical protein